MATRGTGTVPAGGSAADGLGPDLAAAALALARRLADGATLWCVAPDWPEHARHVAVEFVHPVVMGKRALPAVAVPVEGDGDGSTLRLWADPVDAVVAIGPSSPGLLDVLGEARSRDLLTVWIGAGDAPSAGVADHLLWVEGTDPGSARHDGSIALRHHVLWELTHVCLEHPGLAAAGGTPS